MINIGKDKYSFKTIGLEYLHGKLRCIDALNYCTELSTEIAFSHACG